MTSKNGAGGAAKRRESDAAQRPVVNLRHGLRAEGENATQLRDHAVRYRQRKVRERFPNLTAGDNEAVKAYVRQSVLADQGWAEIRRMGRAGEPVPARLQQDWERTQARALRYEDELRRRDVENGADPAAFLRALDGGRT